MYKTFNTGAQFLTENQLEIFDQAIEKKTGCLALPMGSGKTLLSILIALYTCPPDKKILYIVEKTLISSTVYEITKFFGNTLRYEIVECKNKTWEPKKRTQLVITNPQVLSKAYVQNNIDNKFVYYTLEDQQTKRYKYPYIPWLVFGVGANYFYTKCWGVMIIDEVQRYTNVQTIITKALASVCTQYRWLLSGTLTEEPSLPRIFGYYLLLNLRHVPRSLPQIRDMIMEDKYNGLITTMIYRENNKDFIKPKIKKIIISHDLTKQEADIYMIMKDTLLELKKFFEFYKQTHNTEQIHKYSSYLLAMIGYLRQSLVCQILPIASISLDIADESCKSELAQIFNKKFTELKLDTWLNDVNNIVSTRIDKVLNIINRHNSKLVIFSCYRSCIRIVQSLIKDRSCFSVESNMNIYTRLETIQNFEKSDNGLLFLTYKLGGNGLNLQCSDTVILIDCWWNYGMTKQAIARIVRFGQLAKQINVYFFTSNTGVENALFKKCKSKVAIGNEILNGKAKTKLTKMTMKDILRIIDDKKENKNLLKEFII